MHLLGVDWAGQLRQPDPPDPDVTITLTDSLLGIEITGIYDNSEGRPKEEGEQGELLARARRLYESEGHTSVTVGVIWDDRHKVVKRERPHLAQALMELVAQNVPSGNERRELDLRNQEELPLLSLSIHRTRPGGSGYWGASRAAFPRKCSRAEVQRAIDKKAARVSGYRTTCSEVWVLVVANHGDPSTWCTEPESLQTEQFIGPFDRAYFMRLPDSLIRLGLRGSQ